MQRRRTPLRRAHSPNTTVLGLTPAAMAQHIQEQEELRLLKSKNSAMRRRLEENGRYPWSPAGGRGPRPVGMKFALGASNMDLLDLQNPKKNTPIRNKTN